ncbi:hypothetical protein [Bradyrhizobium sp. 195]|uniref:hypothetical protein n=1 Tax=Bradyrhizobium sp. 195 TaxID=2782662 RepID=UPI002000A6ED|nr:hypothetical protein [Bradyrhizobium sp. 195]
MERSKNTCASRSQVHEVKDAEAIARRLASQIQRRYVKYPLLVKANVIAVNLNRKSRPRRHDVASPLAMLAKRHRAIAAALVGWPTKACSSCPLPISPGLRSRYNANRVISSRMTAGLKGGNTLILTS